MKYRLVILICFFGYIAITITGYIFFKKIAVIYFMAFHYILMALSWLVFWRECPIPDPSEVEETIIHFKE